MRARERVRHLGAHRADVRRRERTACDDRRERLAIEKLHHDEGGLLGLFDGEDGDDVRVAQRRGRARLAHEPPTRSLTLRPVGHALDGDDAPEPLVLGFEHRPHPALADLREDAVVEQRRRRAAGGRRHRRRVQRISILAAHPVSITSFSVHRGSLALSYVPRSGRDGVDANAPRQDGGLRTPDTSSMNGDAAGLGGSGNVHPKRARRRGA